MTDTHLHEITVPQPNSKWSYSGRPITVQSVIVKWKYDEGIGCFLHADPEAFSVGGRFTRVSPVFEAGKTYAHIDYADRVFKAYEVNDEGRVYGVVNYNGGAKSTWTTDIREYYTEV